MKVAASSPSARFLFATAALLLLASTSSATAQRFPGDSFGIFPLFGKYSGSAGALTDPQALAELLDLKTQIGENHGHFKVGFNGIYGGKPTLIRNCQLAQANNMSHAVIINVQTHAGPTSIQNIAAADFRNYQWRKDGVTWEGDDIADNRDWQVVTPSRYATALRAQFQTITDSKAIPIKDVMDDYPGVIVSVNACIEEELATRGQADPFLADYSPFAITEFRDWLRHTGLYDADTGAYPTEGAPAAITGSHVMITGKLRSPFYDDPTPVNANGTGLSFNGTFGTGFTTWTLKNWDLTAYPGAITDVGFDPTPASGTGYTAGGFDAPRTKLSGNSFWRAWSWDYQDQSDTYPAGNPSAPAFGFRQTMIRNFVNDVLKWIEDTGIPAALITAHQIPAEMLSSDNRARSSASPIWTGLSKHNGTVGITRYGNISTGQVGLITQYSNDWGIYEWHPKPDETDDAVLHSRAMTQLDLFYANNCRIVCPFTWTDGGPHGTYPVNDSGFATGIKAWLDAQPFTVTGTWTGGGADGSWDNPDNWGGALPTFGNALDVIFSGGTANTTTYVRLNRTINSLTFDAAATDPVSIRLANTATNVSAAAARDLTFDGTAPSIDIDAASTAAHTLGVAAGNVILNQDLTINHDGPADFLIDRAITGTGGLIKNGLGQLTLSPGSGGAGPNANTFTGNVVDAAGPLVITSGSALGAGTKTVTVASGSAAGSQLRLAGGGGDIVLPSSITLRTSRQSDNGALVNLGGNNSINGPVSMIGGGGDTRLTVLGGSLTLNGTVTADIGTGRTLRLAGTGSNTVNGVIQDGIGPASVSVVSGTWTLSAPNTHTGTTTVSGGALHLSGSLAGDLIATGGILAQRGTPAVTGAVTIDSGATFQVRINGPAVGSQYDQLTAAGAVTLDGALDVLPAPGLPGGAVYTILNKTSAGAVGGTFAGKPQGGAFTAGGTTWIISYTGGDGNDVTLTVATAQKAWRFTHFSTVANTGTAADSFDSNGDGENNFSEFSTAQDPDAATTAATTALRNGANIEFTYTRSLAAIADGVTFVVKWSDTLLPDSWSDTGVTEEILIDNGTIQTVKATVAAGTEGYRFLRLEVTAP